MPAQSLSNFAPLMVARVAADRHHPLRDILRRFSFCQVLGEIEPGFTMVVSDNFPLSEAFPY